MSVAQCWCGTCRWCVSSELAQLRAALAQAQRELAELKSTTNDWLKSHDHVCRQLDRVQEELEQAQRERDEARAQLADLKVTTDRWLKDHDLLCDRLEAITESQELIAEELDDALWDAANAPGKAQYHVLREAVERIARELAPTPTTRRRRP